MIVFRITAWTGIILKRHKASPILLVNQNSIGLSKFVFQMFSKYIAYNEVVILQCMGIIDISYTLDGASHTVGRRKLKPERRRWSFPQS